MSYTPVQIFKLLKGVDPPASAWVPCVSSQLELVAEDFLDLWTEVSNEEVNQSIASIRSDAKLGASEAAIWDDRAELVFCSRECLPFGSEWQVRLLQYLHTSLRWVAEQSYSTANWFSAMS